MGIIAADLVHHLSYARIASIPNVTNTGKALLIAGTSMEGTEAAAEFCLRPDSISVLHRELGVESGEPLPPFEIPLSTASEGAPEWRRKWSQREGLVRPLERGTTIVKSLGADDLQCKRPMGAIEISLLIGELYRRQR